MSQAVLSELYLYLYCFLWGSFSTLVLETYCLEYMYEVPRFTSITTLIQRVRNDMESSDMKYEFASEALIGVCYHKRLCCSNFWKLRTEGYLMEMTRSDCGRQFMENSLLKIWPETNFAWEMWSLLKAIVLSFIHYSLLLLLTISGHCLA